MLKMRFGATRQVLKKDIVFIYGPPGTGKTGACQQMCRDLNIPDRLVYVNQRLGNFMDGVQEDTKAIIFEDLDAFRWNDGPGT